MGPTGSPDEDGFLADLIGEAEAEAEAEAAAAAEEEEAGAISEDDPPEEPRRHESSRRLEGGGPSTSACLEGVRSLLRLAVESGGAVILDGESLDADAVRERAAQLARTAPAGPVFRHRTRKAPPQKARKEENQKSGEEEKPSLEMGTSLEEEKRSRPSRRREKVNDGFLDMVPHGSLGVDELAKLLS